MIGRIQSLVFAAVGALYRVLPAGVREAIRLRLKYGDRCARARELVTDDDKAVFRGRVTDSLEETPENEAELIPRLMSSFSLAKQRQTTMSPAYLPSKDWKTLLEEEWQDNYRNMSNGDEAAVAVFLRNFFRNEGISGLWGNRRVFERFCDSDGLEAHRRDLRMLDQYAAWRDKCPDAALSELDAPRIGNPWGYDFGGMVLVEPVFEYHAQARYIDGLLGEIPNPVVLEIGGGYGGLALHLLRRRRRLTYIGLDLPENVLIQAYYLGCAFPDAEILIYDEGFSGLDRTTISEHDIILLPNFTMPDIESSVADLIVNVRSLSEMQAETIEEYMCQLDRIGRLFFFHENLSAHRQDGLHGIPSGEFPSLANFACIARAESSWPKYRRTSVYPCEERLFLHKRVIRASMSDSTGKGTEC